MQNLFTLLLLICSMSLSAQSKSITSFRSDFKESSNVFFYSSTLKMLNTENNSDFAEILKDIEEIRVLNYKKADQNFKPENILSLKESLKKEQYNNIMMINEKGNSVNVYSREKRDITVGFVAIVENNETLMLIDLIGSINIQKFMELKKKLDNHAGSL